MMKLLCDIVKKIISWFRDFENVLLTVIIVGILLTSAGTYSIGTHIFPVFGKFLIIFGMLIFLVSIIIFVFKFA